MEKNKIKCRDSIDNYLIQLELDKLKSNRTARHIQEIAKINEQLKNK